MMELDSSSDDSSDDSSGHSSDTSSDASSDKEALPALDPSAYSRATITWQIDNFSTITELIVRSKCFKANVKPQPKSDNKNVLTEMCFNLHLFPRFQYPHSTNHYSVIYVHSWSGYSSFTMRCRFSVVDATGKQCLTQECKTKLLPHSTSSTTNGFYCLLREHILNPKSGLLKDDALTIFCEIELIDDNESNNPQQMVASKLLQDYDSLLESAKYADVLLVVGKARAKKEFHAHKNILTARSPVFGAMFEHKNTKEAQESKVVITDVVPEVFEQFIRFVYTGKVTEMDKYAQDLLTVADKYQMDCLKSLCSHYLSSKLTTELVSSILVLADLHNAAELKSNCVDYIADHAEQVMETEQFNRHIKNKPELMFELFQKHVKKFKK